MTSLLSRLVRPKPPTTVSETVTLPEHLKSKLLIADPQHAGMAVVLLAVGVASYVMSKSDVVSDDASEHYYFDHSEQKREAAKGTEPVAVDNKNEDAESLLKKHGKKHKGPKYNEVKPDHAHVPLGKPQKDNAGPQRPAPTPQTLDQIVQDLQKLQNSAAVLLDSCKMKAKAITERINRVGVLLDTVPLPDDVRVDSEDFRYIKMSVFYCVCRVVIFSLFFRDSEYLHILTHMCMQNPWRTATRPYQRRQDRRFARPNAAKTAVRNDLHAIHVQKNKRQCGRCWALGRSQGL